MDARHNSLRDWGASAWTLCTGTPAGTEQHVPQWDKHDAESGCSPSPRKLPSSAESNATSTVVWGYKLAEYKRVSVKTEDMSHMIKVEADLHELFENISR